MARTRSSSSLDQAAAPARVALHAGDRIREIETGMGGYVREIWIDNSCGDPECCGSSYPDRATILMDCGHDAEVGADDDGRYAGYEVVDRVSDDHWPVHRLSIDGGLRLEDEKALATRVRGARALPEGDAPLMLGPDASGTGLLVRHPRAGIIARVPWAVVARSPDLRSALAEIGALPPMPDPIPSDEELTAWSVGTLVVDRRTGQPGTIVEVDPAQGAGSEVVIAEYACGHRDAACPDDRACDEEGYPITLGYDAGGRPVFETCTPRIYDFAPWAPGDSRS